MDDGYQAVAEIVHSGIPFARFVSPPLTTVRSPQEEVGSVGWKTLAGGEPGSRTMLAAHPVFRASTAGPAANQPSGRIGDSDHLLG